MTLTEHDFYFHFSGKALVCGPQCKVKPQRNSTLSQGLSGGRGVAPGGRLTCQAVVSDCQWDSSNSYSQVQGVKNKPHHHSHQFTHCFLCWLYRPEWRGKSGFIYVHIGQGSTAKLHMHLRWGFYPRRWGRRWFQVQQRTKGRLEVKGFQNFIHWGSNWKQGDYSW